MSVWICLSFFPQVCITIIHPFSLPCTIYCYFYYISWNEFLFLVRKKNKPYVIYNLSSAGQWFSSEMVYCLFIHSLKLIVYPKPICSIIDLSTPAQNLILYTCTSLLFTPIPLLRGEEKALLQFQQGSGSVTSYMHVFFRKWQTCYST